MRHNRSGLLNHPVRSGKGLAEIEVMGPSSAITLQSRCGAGRAAIVLSEGGEYEAIAQGTVERLGMRSTTLLLKVAGLSGSSWDQTVRALHELLAHEGVKHGTFIAFGATSYLIEHLAIFTPKLVRAAVLVDGMTRAEPTKAQRMVARLEAWLPLGLPLRMRSKEFDAKPFLHRVRCPILLITTKRATEWQRSEGRTISQSLPTSYGVAIAEGVSSEQEVQTLVDLIDQFGTVPARAPQKNRSMTGVG